MMALEHLQIVLDFTKATKFWVTNYHDYILYNTFGITVKKILTLTITKSNLETENILIPFKAAAGIPHGRSVYVSFNLKY
jgi:hypothetical protein